MMDTLYWAREPDSRTWILYLLVTIFVVLIVAGDPIGIGSRYGMVPGASVIGARFPLEPRWLTRCRFYSSGWDIIQEGCDKDPSRMFTVLRPESNITILPRKYVDELANMPEDRLATNEATINDMMRQYTGADILLKRYIGHHAINTKLTPQLELLVFAIKEELLVTASETPLQVTDHWSEQRLSPYVSKLMCRITSHLFLGKPICRDPLWLDLFLNLTVDIYETIVVLRNAPRFTHPFLGATMPARRRLRKHMKELHHWLKPLVEERMANDAKHQSRGKMQSEAFTKPNDVMQWMMDLASDDEYTSENMANRFIYTIMGSIRSVVDVVVNSLHELCERPEYIEPLRDEMTKALEEDLGWGKRTASKLPKTDSFLKEISRHYPPSALAFRRLSKEKISLQDGVVIPKNTYLCVATTSPSLDEVSEPEKFDGFRYYQERVAQGREGISRCDYSATDKNHLGFGHGKYACPGRFAASVEAKMILTHILLQYDLALPPGRTTRPPRVKLMDFKTQDGKVTTYMRRRQSKFMTLSDFEKAI